jgi:hypothetical protein
MVVNLGLFHLFWESLDALPDENITDGGDQSLVILFHNFFPRYVGSLPIEWDSSMGNGHKKFPEHLLVKRPNGVGFLHFNGQRSDRDTYWFGEKGIMKYCLHRNCLKSYNKDRFRATWRLAEYYVWVSWSWVIYFGGQSKLRFDHPGYNLTLHIIQ